MLAAGRRPHIPTMSDLRDVGKRRQHLRTSGADETSRERLGGGSKNPERTRSEGCIGRGSPAVDTEETARCLPPSSRGPSGSSRLHEPAQPGSRSPSGLSESGHRAWLLASTGAPQYRVTGSVSAPRSLEQVPRAIACDEEEEEERSAHALSAIVLDPVCKSDSRGHSNLGESDCHLRVANEESEARRGKVTRPEAHSEWQSLARNPGGMGQGPDSVRRPLIP